MQESEGRVVVPRSAGALSGGFDFGRDTIAFPNETKWEYWVDEATGRQRTRRREPPPTYALRCFVLVRAVKQFFGHVAFRPEMAAPDIAELRRLLRRALSRSPRWNKRSATIEMGGHTGLRELSERQPALLKDCLSGAWRSYLQRGHWRMVLPVTARHQRDQAERVVAGIGKGIPQAVHVYTFPALTINHALLVYRVIADDGVRRFDCYDPNSPEASRALWFDEATGRFRLERNHYFVGGRVMVYRIYSGLLY